ncbi:hypothetical protein BO78DRAFT_444887 [Aspergillus sclerotiicarbonarius CBS 121057]|uniref:Secreted protein CSS2 C-terminal domain-containing protein n=1 Tax=Aspergillus sclerotiicarbonarius (strain CBS 121057 / IBT 28362) TaxID=1448318 RepID=A0A319E994_ASPSB|nr:hypothetical protein BO78DRAFT_444887 [Aspergillus sclerotiicarbonarius CBS 121057]
MNLYLLLPPLLALIIGIYLTPTPTISSPTIRHLTFTLNEKLLNRAPDCHPTRGTIEELWDHTRRIDGVWKYAYHTYRIPGKTCGVSFAQSEMIGKAVEDYILNEAEKYEECDTQCLRLDKGGDWDGWIALGMEGRFDEGVDCGPSLVKLVEEGKCGGGYLVERAF